jgi:hypothetical protein
MSRTTHTSSSIGREFMTFGPEGMAVHRADERRAEERQRNQITHALRATQQTPWLRRALGTMMIALGTGISGKAARIQEREATSPLPEARGKLAPTR